MMKESNLDQKQQAEVVVGIKLVTESIINKKYIRPKFNLTEGNITTGFHDIDKITGGFKRGEITTIAVRPGIGKTSYLLSMLNNIALLEGHGVGIFSMERTAEQLTKRLIQTTSGISLDKINEGELSDHENNYINSIIKTINNSTILFNDHPGLSTDTIKENSLKMLKLGAEIIFIDYLELLHTNNSKIDSEEGNGNQIMKELNTLAKDLKIPIVLFSQLQKPIIYKNKYKYTPDYINENTDSLMFLNRPSYYHINQIDKIAEDIAEVTIAKNINIGEMQLAKLKIIESLGLFSDL